MRRILFPLLGLAGIGLFAFILVAVGPASVLEEIWALRWEGYVAVVLDVVLAFIFWSIGWTILLRAVGIGVSWWRTLLALVSGFAVSYITPSAYIGGEPIRVMLIAGQAAPATVVTATVIVERILSALSTLTFAALGGFFVVASPKIPASDKQVLLWGLGSLGAAVVLAFWGFLRNYRWLSRLFLWLHGLVPGVPFLGRAGSVIREVEEKAHLVFSGRPLHALSALLFEGLGVFCLYMRPQVFFGVGMREWLTFPKVSLYFSLNTVLSAFFWITPAGMGIAEGGRAAIFRVIGIAADKAVAYTLAFRFLEFLFVAFGIYYLLGQGLDFLGRRRG